MRSLVALALAASLFGGIATAESAERPSAEVVNTLVRDVAEILQTPMMLNGGRHRVLLQSMEVLDWDTRHLTSTLRLRYQKTRGFPLYSTSGTARARFTFYPGNNGEMCLGDVVIEHINVNRIPEFLDNAWLGKKLQKRLPSEVCAK